MEVMPVVLLVHSHVWISSDIMVKSAWQSEVHHKSLALEPFQSQLLSSQPVAVSSLIILFFQVMC